ncbi:hypothetical protein KC343_g7129 [Hortaea werneckii]|nr:hypothetical protein KC317_g7420 [Hortaea werneckii]KAI7612497.1 hypothetical protein KC346_g7800 [Hortaea werneckii]KAI7623992.1 hypothetical protein KC343_g7129 [Hortaea werneckii]KAI7666104.1 hypothetical protein KC319_g7018 [Hortaea werneckii]
MLTIPLLALRNLQNQPVPGGLLGGASSSRRSSRTNLPPHQDGPFLPSSSSSPSPSSSSLLRPAWTRPRHASIYGTTRSSADEALLGQSARAEEERYGSSESRVVSEGVGEVRETRIENLEHEEMEGSGEALFLKRASEIESGKVGVTREGRKTRVLRKKARRDSKKVGESTSLFRDTEIGPVQSNEEKEREAALPGLVDLGREVTGDHDDGVLNSDGKRRFSRRLTSVGCAFNRVSNKVVRKMTGFATSRKGSAGSNSSEGAVGKGEEGEALIVRDQQSSADDHSQHCATSSPIASDRELRGSGSSRQTLYSPSSSPAETMPVTPSYTRDDGGPLEPCPTKLPCIQPSEDHNDDEDSFFPNYDQALPSSSPHPPRPHQHPSPSPPTSTTNPTKPPPNQHPETPPHLRSRLSGTQTPLTNTQYAQMIQLSHFHAQRTGAYAEEEISRAYRFAPGNVTKAGEQRKAAEIWRLKVEAARARVGGEGVAWLEEKEEGEVGEGMLAAAVSRRRMSLRRLLPGRK